MMNFRILAALLRKEFLMMKSNPIMPRVILIMPVVVMLVMPLVANLDVSDVRVAIVDNDRTQLSRRVVADLSAPRELNVAALCGTPAEAMDLIDRGDADLVVTIPRHFERDLSRVLIQANGVNATKASLGAQYAAGSVGRTLAAWSAQTGRGSAADAVSVVNLYNPTLDFRNFMVPALIVVLLIIICGFLPVLDIMTEVESGTIEAINVTPVGKFTFILSKLLPFWIVGLIVITEGMLIGRIVYGLAPQGSIAAIYLVAILFSLFMSGLGVAVANGSSTILQSIFVMMAFIIIFQLMGGLFTPIDSMPRWAQYITYAVPPRYFNTIIRSLYLKGTTIAELWQPFAALAAYAFGACLLAALTYRKRS